MVDKTAFGLINNLQKRNMPKIANKGSGSNKCKSKEKQNGTDKFILYTKKQLEDVIKI